MAARDPRTQAVKRTLGLALICGVWCAEASAACPATPDQVADEATRAAQAFILMDEAAYSQAIGSMREGLTCLTGPPTVAQAALVHRAEALDAFSARDEVKGVAALRAMRECDPLLGLSEELAPSGGPLQTWYQQARTLPVSPRHAAEVPEGLTLVVDGRPSADLPLEHDSVVVLLKDREVVLSALLGAGQTLPFVPMAPPPVERSIWPTATLATAGGLLLVSGGLWTAGFIGRGKVLEAQSTIAEGQPTDLNSAALGNTYDRSRGAFIAAEIGTGLALGVGALGLVGVVRW